MNRKAAEILNNLTVTAKKLWRRDKVFVISGGVIFLVLLIWLMIPRSDQRIGLAAEQVMTLADRVRTHYRAKPSYWGLDTALAVASGIVPTEMLNNGRIVNALGQDVHLGTGENADTVMPGSSGFDVVYPGIVKSACIGLLSYRFTKRQELGLKAVTVVNDRQIVFSWGGENPLPADIQKAREICKGKNSLIWSFE